MRAAGREGQGTGGGGRGAWGEVEELSWIRYLRSSRLETV